MNNIKTFANKIHLISHSLRIPSKLIRISNQSKMITFFLNENFISAEIINKINTVNALKPILRAMMFNNFRLISNFSVLLFYFQIPVFIFGSVLLQAIIRVFNATQISVSITNFISFASLRMSQFLFPIWLKSLNLCSLILFSLTVQGLQLITNLLKLNFVCALIPVSFHAFSLTSIATPTLIRFFVWSYSIPIQFALLTFLISWYNFSLSKRVCSLR